MPSSDRAPPFRKLICGGLHYCCPFAFFSVMKKRDTEVLADRLGCARRTVQHWRQRFQADEFECEEKEKCAYARLLEMGEALERREALRDPLDIP